MFPDDTGYWHVIILQFELCSLKECSVGFHQRATKSLNLSTKYFGECVMILQPSGRGPSRYFAFNVINGSLRKTGLSYIWCFHIPVCNIVWKRLSLKFEEGKYINTHSVSEASPDLSELVNLKFLQDRKPQSQTPVKLQSYRWEKP